MGEMQAPADALDGAQTARALESSPILKGRAAQGRQIQAHNTSALGGRKARGSPAPPLHANRTHHQSTPERL